MEPERGVAYGIFGWRRDQGGRKDGAGMATKMVTWLARECLDVEAEDDARRRRPG